MAVDFSENKQIAALDSGRIYLLTEHDEGLSVKETLKETEGN